MSSSTIDSVGGSSSYDLSKVTANIRNDGVGVLPHVFTAGEIAHARETVLAHIDVMKNTRPTPSSRHLAGFHRFPGLEPIHQLITGNRATQVALAELLGPNYRTIGLSDITINRSQQWHKDLLRGQFSRYIDDEHPCTNHHGKVFKVILYLQNSTSLLVVPGSHRRDVPLDNDNSAIPAESEPVTRIETQAGDAVIIDICTTHRGSGEEAYATLGPTDTGRMLVSTVFGGANCDFTDWMELGNAERLSVWQRNNR